MNWKLTLFACGVIGWNGIAAAQPAVLDRVTNVQKAATEIAAVQAKTGADGASAAINDCYKRELAHATALTRGLEACAAQDIIVSKVWAAVYARLSAEGRRIAGDPEPEAVIKAMVRRVVGIFARFKVPQDDAIAFNRIVQAEGMEAYGKALFPNALPATKN